MEGRWPHGELLSRREQALDRGVTILTKPWVRVIRVPQGTYLLSKKGSKEAI